MGTRAAVIGGANGTNVRAEKLFGIPVLEPIPILLYRYMEAILLRPMRKPIKIVSSSSIPILPPNIGVPATIQVAREMGEKDQFLRRSVDSGDIAYISKKFIIR